MVPQLTIAQQPVRSTVPFRVTMHCKPASIQPRVA